MKRIVLTGAPCSGKSAVSAALTSESATWILVPEAATQVYSTDGTRWDRLNLDQRRDTQRRIYQLQLRQEEQAAKAHPGKHLLLDRGTIDGSAYWPDGVDAYWSEMGTTHATELARYDTVILMETAAALGIYALETNKVRFENAESAIANGKLLDRLWGRHRNLIRVPAFPSIAEKIHAVKAILNAF